ncbi:MAG: hypothetical protein JSU90_11485 [Nitrospiraceae bacterium]|nr:MAG: hypothetical protein JSU90_11485 [Nitrospiraceae bacterium]
MTKVTVHSGQCGFSVVISAEKRKDGTVGLSLDTECEMINNMEKDITGLGMMSFLAGPLNNPVYRAAAKHLKHVACPVVSGILKAVEVEAGCAVPKDVHIVFSKD